MPIPFPLKYVPPDKMAECSCKANEVGVDVSEGGSVRNVLDDSWPQTKAANSSRTLTRGYQVYFLVALAADLVTWIVQVSIAGT